MEQKTPWHIFFKSFRNQATPEELAEINDWLGKDIENLKLLEEIYHVFTISTVLPPPLSPDTREAWNKVEQKISEKVTTPKILTLKYWHAAAIAAIIVLSLLVLGIVDNYRTDNRLARQFTEVVTLPGQKTSIVLPDGTKIWLNAASSVKYPANFNKKEREVILSGEAFFKVHKDQSKRFRVKSGMLNIDVYGTSFNVRNYPDVNLQKITVAEGIVGIAKNSEEIRRLTKGEQATFNKESGEIAFNKENPELVAAWKNNELIFQNTPIDEVIKSLESWYGVKITIDNQMIGSHNYTFKIKTESFREVLDMMKLMTPFEYKIDGKDIEIKYINK
ncbi:MAG: FecR family protein [Mangrovibacterium sp.]